MTTSKPYVCTARESEREIRPCECHSSFSSCSSLASTTSLLVSSISPARNTSSRMAYTYPRFNGIRACTKRLRPYLVEVEHQIKLADIVEERVLRRHRRSGTKSKQHLPGHGGCDIPSTSTNKWIASRYASSLSFASTQMQKNKPA